MPKLIQSACLSAAAALLLVASSGVASAQSPVVVTTLRPAAPAVVGYAPVRWGFFGRRLVYRPVVAPTAVVSQQVVVGAPTVAGYAPAPVTSYYAPAPVTSYYAPAPVSVYRAPIYAPYFPY